jgi:hypothetical protein
MMQASEWGELLFASFLTKGKDTEEVSKVFAGAAARILMQYPVEVVAAACLQIPLEQKWRPELKEIKDACDKRWHPIAQRIADAISTRKRQAERDAEQLRIGDRPKVESPAVKAWFAEHERQRTLACDGRPMRSVADIVADIANCKPTKELQDLTTTQLTRETQSKKTREEREAVENKNRETPLDQDVPF